jgi:hypothetical protein
MSRNCGTCKHSRQNNGSGEWCVYSTNHECHEHDMWERHGEHPIPTSPDRCGNLYPDESDIPYGMCLKCKCSTLSTQDSRHCPLGATTVENMQRDEVIVVGSRYYQPPTETMIEQCVPFPVLIMEEE